MTEYRGKLTEALKAGLDAMSRAGGTSLDAVEAAIKVMEDSPLFNAGKGSVFTVEGRNELDAAIMDGQSKKAGAVGGTTIIKNPISAARAVMEKSKHVLLAGRGADLFATQSGLTIVDPSYFWTEKRWKQFQDASKAKGEKSASTNLSDHKYGTVGAVALDRNGNLAAGTSTGGTVMKLPGRLGDSPIIGAGTYADNKTAAISATGDGEFFLRAVAAYDVSAQMEYKGVSVKEAAENVVMKKIKDAGGEGALIALDAKGNLAMPFNTEGMYRGYALDDGTVNVAIFEN